MALYRSVAEDTLDYCLRELKAPGGGYYCGQDADSGGVEGAYYLFTPEEIAHVLGEEDGRHFCQCYDITEEGNFDGESIPNLLINQRWNFLPGKRRWTAPPVWRCGTPYSPWTVCAARRWYCFIMRTFLCKRSAVFWQFRPWRCESAFPGAENG